MNLQKSRSLLLILAPLLLLIIVYIFAERWLRAALLYLSHATWARRIVTGFAPAWFVARRFVAGETISDAMRVTQELNEEGILATLDFLGESVTDPSEARLARDEILALLDAIHASGLSSGVSVKPSQLGIEIDAGLALENMRCILDRARQYGLFVRMDMEESALVDATLKVFRHLQQQEGYDNVGVVIQSYLYRSEGDVRALIDIGASVRLCKGAYMESPEVAFPQKKDTDENFVRLMELLLGPHARENGVHAAIATHDENMVRATLDFAREQNLPGNSFELQMLYGIRRELQARLVDQGYRVRVYVPYGTAWYPYLMRRLAERPANLWFFVSNLIRH